MKFGWKVLIPVSIIWIVIVASARILRDANLLDTRLLLFFASAVLFVGVVISYYFEIREKKRQALIDNEKREREARGFDPFEGGFPVPPMPGQSAQPSRLASIKVAQTQAPVAEVEGQ